MQKWPPTAGSRTRKTFKMKESTNYQLTAASNAQISTAVLAFTPVSVGLKIINYCNEGTSTGLKAAVIL